MTSIHFSSCHPGPISDARGSFSVAGLLRSIFIRNNDNVIAVVELPGMRKEDIEISLHEGTLTINGERKSESSNGEKAERTERYIGKFRRSITLPARVDANKVSATYRDGILTVTLPKAEEAKPKQIQVNAG